MRSMPTFFLMISILAANVRCGGSKASAGDGGATCNGQQAVCPGHPYAACVEIQDSLGRCVDWSMLGASACSTGPDDCPATRPSASFAGAPAGTSSAICVKASDIQFSTGAASPGYCAAIQAYTDATGAATCTPNPCGDTGYCSFLRPTAGGSIVSCMWPI